MCSVKSKYDALNWHFVTKYEHCIYDSFMTHVTQVDVTRLALTQPIR